MSKPEYAIFVDGPWAGRVMTRPDAPDYLSDLAVAHLSEPVIGLERSELDLQPLSAGRVYYRALRGALPFGYVPYMVSSQGFTLRHAETATRMVELLVEQGHAETNEGLRKTAGLLERRLAGLERRLSAVIANHGLSDLVDETGGDK